jgi:hypothetical protein
VMSIHPQVSPTSHLFLLARSNIKVFKTFIVNSNTAFSALGISRWDQASFGSCQISISRTHKQSHPTVNLKSNHSIKLLPFLKILEMCETNNSSFF